MHFERHGKANGSALHSLEMSAEVEILAFDALRVVFVTVVTLGIERLAELCQWPVKK